MRVAGAIGIAIVIAFFATLVYTTARAVSCEVCIDFDGRSLCRTASGGDRDEALMSARTTACAVLSQGVTRGMACNRTPARSETCTGGE